MILVLRATKSCEKRVKPGKKNIGGGDKSRKHDNPFLMTDQVFCGQQLINGNSTNCLFGRGAPLMTKAIEVRGTRAWARPCLYIDG